MSEEGDAAPQRRSARSEPAAGQASGGRIAAAARAALGLRLRPEQKQAVERVVAGRDTLCVMPTGSGKSAIYQVAATLVPGATLVVSPLIALQRDQVESLEESEAGEAAAVNSLQTGSARGAALRGLRAGRIEFLFVSPEQLANEDVLARLRRAQPSLLVVDEAHCISQWGHDFRPDYLQLGKVAQRLGRPTILALTATASPRVREDVIRHLGMREPHVLVQGFDRPNIWLGATSHPDEAHKLDALLAYVKQADKPGIVYVGTRRLTTTVRDALEGAGVSPIAYHAGMSAAEREWAHGAFMPSREAVMVATNAFGMGIDKPDVRFVVHYTPSDSLDSYYQEIGRAGRDGGVAQALLLYRRQDLALHRFFAGAGRLTAADVERVLDALAAGEPPARRKALAGLTGLSQLKVTRAVHALAELGAVELTAVGRATLRERPAERGETARDALALLARRRDAESARLELLHAYAETSTCRRAMLLRYFGEDAPDRCGFCDSCDSGRSERVAARLAVAVVPGPRVRATARQTAAAARAARSPRQRPATAAAFAPGTWAEHRAFGRGMVVGRDGDHVEIA
ncbi:MAG: RecQ family ATP-dependent DNA helicase, partial [Thermodesulfobacteriota bacterium]